MATDRWFDERWERYTNAEFLKRTRDEDEQYCVYARKFHEWATNLVENATTTNPDAISINQAKLKLLDRYWDWYTYVPKRHRETTGGSNSHACIFSIFLQAYTALKICELSLTPPLLFLPPSPPPPPPPPPPHQIAGIFLGLDDEGE